MSSVNMNSVMECARINKNVLRKKQLRHCVRLKSFLITVIVQILTFVLCDVCLITNDLGVKAQKIDCAEGYLCDFFNRFPHLPFSKLHTQNLGYIRTLDYMISKDKDVHPHRHYSSNPVNDDNYYKKELSEIRKAPLYKVATSPIFPPVFKHTTGRNYEPKVCSLISKKIYLLKTI